MVLTINFHMIITTGKSIVQTEQRIKSFAAESVISNIKDNSQKIKAIENMHKIPKEGFLQFLP